MAAPHKTMIAKRGIYILPSFFTIMGLFSGFYALIAAVQGRYELAAWAILAAAVFDMLDGRVARLLHAETAFGAELDSLCDMVSFGLAPALLVYMWALVGLGPELHKLAWLGAFFLVACAALRLARFNVQIGVQDKRYFQGLPTPGAALFIATAVLFHEQGGYQPMPWLWFFLSVALAWLMVSGVRFVSGKDIDLKKRRPFAVLVGIVLVVGLVTADPYKVLFGVLLVYCLHGPVMSAWQYQKASRYRVSRRLARKRKRQEAAEKDD